MSAPLVVRPLDAPPDVTIEVPGSKSLTNRALVAAALAEGMSTISGALVADDTEAMVECLRAVGVGIDGDDRLLVEGIGRPARGPATLDAQLSGTTARFLAPVLALGSGTYVLDGGAPLRARPMGPLVEALRSLGTQVEGDRLPLRITADGLAGGHVHVRGDISSQFISGLLLAAPRATSTLTIDVEGDAVSRPYLDLTVSVMRAFHASVEQEGHARFVVQPTGYWPHTYAIEPDASAASYFFAAAAITGGRVTVRGLGTASGQGDLAFVDVLAAMGAHVERTADATTVTGTGELHGVSVDMANMSDTAQTLAAVAVFADSPTEVTGIGFIRRKETDRVGDVITELARVGVRAEDNGDGWVVHPGTPHGATIETYDDHRMAMSFALLGLRVPGIEIADPGCVAKTFPEFWSTFDQLRSH